MDDDGLNAPENPQETAKRLKLAADYLARRPVPLFHKHGFAEVIGPPPGNALGHTREVILGENE